jgi:hypothetical protein
VQRFITTEIEFIEMYNLLAIAQGNDVIVTQSESGVLKDRLRGTTNVQ